jgi:hypothetical protein
VMMWLEQADSEHLYLLQLANIKHYVLKKWGHQLWQTM